MIRPLLALLAVLALTSSALAGPGKILVLPLDGDAAPELRAQYSASVQRLARTLDGKVTTGDVTFTDTATAIGCDPKQPQCAEDVRATLGVDELIYGTVTKDGGKVVVVVRRQAKGKPRREVTTTREAGDAADRAEPELLPLFQRNPGDPAKPNPVVVPDEEKPQPEPPPPPPPKTPIRRAQVIGYAAIGGGATLLLISFALWSSASGLEEEIASHPVDEHDDFVALRDLEDRARTRAWTGNVMFLAGLAAGGYGGWTLYRDRQAQRHATVAPAPVPGGAGVMLRGSF